MCIVPSTLYALSLFLTDKVFFNSFNILSFFVWNLQALVF